MEVSKKRKLRTSLDERLMSYVKYKSEKVYEILEDWVHKEMDEDVTLGIGFTVRSKQDGAFRLSSGEVRIVGVTTDKVYREYTI